MTALFWISAILMIFAAIGILLYFTLRQTEQMDPEAQDASINIDIARQRLTLLQTQLAQNEISQNEYDEYKKEVELVLAQDTTTSVHTALSPMNRRQQSITFVLLFVFVPVLSLTLYFILGKPDAALLLALSERNQPTTTATNSQHSDAVSLEDAIGKLAQRLKAEPNNSKGWLMLARSYMHLQRFNDAANAYARVHALLGDQPEVLIQYADALSMMNAGSLQGKPFELINKALQVSPQHPTALWLAALAHEQNSNYQEALKYWQKVIPLLSEQPQLVAEAQQNAQRVQSKLDGNYQPPSPQQTAQAMQDSSPRTATQDNNNQAQVQVAVSIDASLQAKINPNATVFVFARAEHGPPMPLAVARKSVTELPFTVTLTDGMAMTPTTRLSDFKRIFITARISNSGQARAATGDFQGKSAVFDVTTKNQVALTINQEIQ